MHPPRPTSSVQPRSPLWHSSPDSGSFARFEMAETVRIETDDDGARLDRWFKRHYPALGHGRLEKLLRTGQVRLDGKRAKAGDRISTGQIIRLPPQLQTLHSAVDNSSTVSQPRNSQLT